MIENPPYPDLLEVARRVCWSYSLPVTDADDAVQDLLLHLIESGTDWKPGRATLQTWARVCLSRTVVPRMLRRARTVARVERDRQPERIDPPQFGPLPDTPHESQLLARLRTYYGCGTPHPADMDRMWVCSCCKRLLDRDHYVARLIYGKPPKPGQRPVASRCRACNNKKPTSAARKANQ